MHIGSRNHNQKTRRTELFVLVTASRRSPGADPVSRTCAGLEKLFSLGIPPCQGSSGHLPSAFSPHQPPPRSANPPFCLAKALGRSLEEALGFSVSLASGRNPASKLHRLPPPAAQPPRAGSTLPRQTPSLSLPGGSSKDEPPLLCKHPTQPSPCPARWGPLRGLPPPTLNMYWQSIAGKHSTLETDASPTAARGSRRASLSSLRSHHLSKKYCATGLLHPSLSPKTSCSGV